MVPLGVELVAQRTLGVEEVEEVHHTFLENALLKARHASRFSGLPALADDSGLCTVALQGAPGVRSARFAADAGGAVTIGSGRVPAGAQTRVQDQDQDQAWATEELSEEKRSTATVDARNNAELLRRLAGQTRAAWYVCVLVLVRSPDDPHPIVVDAIWRGEVVDEPRGHHGFGYDPHFFLPDLGMTVAELEPAHKNAVSHRGRAIQALLARLRELH